MPAPTVHTSRGLDRIVNYTDAVVAIAITLLVLPLVDIGMNTGGLHAFDLLRDHFLELGAFLLTFAVMTLFWTTHHSLFERIGDYDGRLVWLNALWLLGIVLFPFASELISSQGFSAGAGVLYCSTMATLALVQALIVTHVRNRPELWSASARYLDYQPGWHWIDLAYFVGAAAISSFAPAVAAYSLLGLIVIVPLRYRRLRDLRTRR